MKTEKYNTRQGNNSECRPHFTASGTFEHAPDLESAQIGTLSIFALSDGIRDNLQAKDVRALATESKAVRLHERQKNEEELSCSLHPCHALSASRMKHPAALTLQATTVSGETVSVTTDVNKTWEEVITHSLGE